MDEFAGTEVLEQLAAIGKVDDFLAAIDADDFHAARLLMRKAGVDPETIEEVIKEARDQD